MINTDYSHWYLQNLTNTQAVQSSKYSAKNSEAARTLSAAEQNNYDKVDFSRSARISLENAAQRTEKSEQSSVSDEEKPDYRAISLIKNSKIDIPEPKTDELARTETVSANEQPVQKTDVQIERPQTLTEIKAEKKAEKPQEAEENVTTESSATIAEEQSQTNVTPAQQKGIQAYQRIQDYSNSLNVSNAVAASIA